MIYNNQRTEVEMLISHHSFTNTSVQTKGKNGYKKYKEKSTKKGQVDNESRIEQNNKKKK